LLVAIISELHGGQVVIVSSPGVGTAVTPWLPAVSGVEIPNIVATKADARASMRTAIGRPIQAE
jgi:hypothetical protein